MCADPDTLSKLILCTPPVTIMFFVIGFFVAMIVIRAFTGNIQDADENKTEAWARHWNECSAEDQCAESEYRENIRNGMSESSAWAVYKERLGCYEQIREQRVDALIRKYGS